jgi:hypothetical protein
VQLHRLRIKKLGADSAENGLNLTDSHRTGFC